MLGKVMKYEWRACGRLLFPFFAVAVALCAVLRLGFFIAPRLWEPIGTALNGLSALLGVLVITAVVLLTFVVCLVRFYQATMSKESYLTFTLPVGAGTQVGGRLIVQSVYGIISALVSVVCVLVLVPGLMRFLMGNTPVPVSSSFSNVTEVTLSEIPSDLVWSFIGMMAVSVVVGTVLNLLIIYVSLALGTRITRNRIVGGILAYLIIYTVENIAMLPLALPFMNSYGSTNSAFVANITASGATDKTFVFMGAMLDMAWKLLLITGLINLVMGVAHFLITRHIFAKKLNVE